MKSIFAATALTAVLACSASAAPSADKAVAYSVSPELTDGKLTALVVDIRFQGDADGETRLGLPDHWASEKELWTRVKDLKVEGAVSVAEDGPQVRVIKARPGAPLHIRYRVISGYDADPAVGAGNPFKPVVRPDWFEFHGETVFATPQTEKGESDDSRPARFRWGEGFPAGWRMASDLEHGAMGRRMLVGDIVESITLGGADVTVQTQTVGGAVLRVAMRGHWTFTDADFAALTTRIIAAQRGFWNDVHDPYLVTLMPVTGGSETVTSIGGTGRTDAFALYATPESAGGAALRYVVAHENTHTWIPRRIGGMPTEHEETDYWLSEGFTDFYTYRTLLRSGVWSLEDFTGELNTTLSAYADSPVREAPNSLIVTDFWKNQPTEKLPYQRGLFLGFLWDARLRAASHGRYDLDDVMLAMRDDATARKDGAPPPLATRLLPTAFAAKGGGDLAPDIARYVEKGEAILLPADLFGECAKVETVTMPKFARGWDGGATTKAGNVVTGLSDNSPAYAAGLRNGMKIVKREFGKPGDSRVEYGLRVLIDGKEQVIRFMPVGKGSITLQTVTLTPGMDDAKRSACVKSMSGT
jgi:predicted metalloprotease with PDZ domain